MFESDFEFDNGSGYDFGYLLKLLTCNTLPAEENDFFDLLKTYFPCIYDIKYLMKSCKTLKGGLQEVADDLQVGAHRTGSRFSGFLNRLP